MRRDLADAARIAALIISFSLAGGVPGGVPLAVARDAATVQPVPDTDDDPYDDKPDTPVAERGYSSLEVTEAPGTRELQNALMRLAADSRNLDALIDAGNAALLLGDPQAALGFFARGDTIDPRNGRVKAGLGSALVRSKNPYEGLRLFGEATALGAPDTLVAADRGLAYALVGNVNAALDDYELALRRGGDDELVRRYALALGIAGDRAAAEAQLDPLLRKSDAAAWRVRAFVLAIDGDEDGAVKIARSTMPDRLASAIEPFLRSMDRLTPAQQAGAVQFGIFPKKADIGRDDPRNSQFASAGTARRRVARADAGLIPAGDALGTQAGRGKKGKKPKPDKSERRRPGRASETQLAAASAPPTPTPTPTPAPKPNLQPKPETQPVPAPAPPSRPSPEPQATSTAAPLFSAAPELRETARPQPGPAVPDNRADRPAARDVSPPMATGPAFAGLAPTTAPAASPKAMGPPISSQNEPVVPLAAQPEARPAEERISLASVISNLSVPEAERRRDPAAVDITRITPARPKPPEPEKKPDKKPEPPKNPSRHWVQVAGGANSDTLPREWKRLSAQAPDAFKGKQGWWTPLNRTNRLLAGPFESDDAAQDFVNQLAKADLAAFTFTSAEGQQVNKLGK